MKTSIISPKVSLQANLFHDDQTPGSQGDVDSYCRTMYAAGNSAITPVQTPALWRLAGFIPQQHQHWQERETPPDFERFERELHEHVMALERALLTDEIKRYDVTADEITVDGVSYRPSVESTQTYMAIALKPPCWLKRLGFGSDSRKALKLLKTKGLFFALS